MVAVPYSFLFLFSFFYSLFFYSLFFSSPNEAKITKNASEVLAQAKGRAMLGKVEKRAEELYVTSTLPHHPDMKRLDALCVEIVESFLSAQ